MITIGLIAAMTLESDAILRCVKTWKRIAVGPLRGHRFELAGHSCVLVTSGMGARRAREAARIQVEMCHPQRLISFGIAGAVEGELEIGDVVLVEAACQIDQGVPGPLFSLEPWTETAQEAVVQVLTGRGARQWVGTAITTGSSHIEQDQLRGLRHPILEMETASIAQLAAEKGIPLLSLRAISDGPRAPIPFDLEEIMDEDANLQAGRLLKAIVHNPGIIFQSRCLMRNIRIAADNAARALLAALRA